MIDFLSSIINFFKPRSKPSTIISTGGGGGGGGGFGGGAGGAGGSVHVPPESVSPKSIGFVLLPFLFIIGGIFYWYSYKPSQIRAKCLAEAEFTPTATLMSDEKERQQFIDTYYKNCIRRFGLEK